MRALLERKGVLAAAIAAGGALVAVLSRWPSPGASGSLLLSLLFLIAVAEGCIAAAAAGEMVNARWVGSVRKELLSVVPLLLLAAFLLLLTIPFLDAYPWARHPGKWLRKDFFIGRNALFLLLAYATAMRFAASPPGAEEAKRRASWYLLVFVASQSLTAFDLVMSLEYPWISALLGGFFFVESLFAGFAASALFYLLVQGRPATAPEPGSRSDLSDLSVLMFGFSLMWAGLFFAQFLTIWYGNIPEEVGFIARRVSSSPLRELSVAALLLLFFIPFLVLLPTRAKSHPLAVSLAAVSVLSGVAIERYVFLAPAVRIFLPGLAIQLVCVLLLFAAAAHRNPGRS
ncbi:MAG: hypothetical protein AB1346_07880 [Thermodesulfobacteriota bacterium]